MAGENIWRAYILKNVERREKLRHNMVLTAALALDVNDSPGEIRTLVSVSRACHAWDNSTVLTCLQLEI